MAYRVAVRTNPTQRRSAMRSEAEDAASAARIREKPRRVMHATTGYACLLRVRPTYANTYQAPWLLSLIEGCSVESTIPNIRNRLQAS